MRGQLLYRIMWVFIISVGIGSLAYAQEETPEPVPTSSDRITNGEIRFGGTVTDTITDQSFFDRFTFNVAAGDVILARMDAEDGLAPLLGIADVNGEIIARSDIGPAGEEMGDANTNTTIELRFEVPQSGQYALVPTRVGNDAGTTTGSYTLSLTRISSTGFMSGDPEMSFNCGEINATTIASLRFNAGSGADSYRISVYGFEDFTPLISLQWGGEAQITDCSSDSQAMGGDVVTFPGAEAVTFEGETPTNAAQFSLRGGAQIGTVMLNVGGIDGAEGRFMLVIEGFSLTQTGQTDLIEALFGPAMVDNGGTFYMVKTGISRLDPEIEIDYEGGETICDDAGVAGCSGVVPFAGAGVQFNDGNSVSGDRFTAGATVIPGEVMVLNVQLRSRARSATGDYALVLTGRLAPPQIGPQPPPSDG